MKGKQLSKTGFVHHSSFIIHRLHGAWLSR